MDGLIDVQIDRQKDTQILQCNTAIRAQVRNNSAAEMHLEACILNEPGLLQLYTIDRQTGK